MTAKTRADLIEAISEQFGVYKYLAVTGGSVTTIIDTGDLLEPDSYWVNHWAYVLDAGGAAPEGEERPVTEYDQDTNTITVAPAFSAAIQSGDTIELLPTRRAQVGRAINSGIRAMAEAWPVLKDDATSITIAANDFDYALPADLVRLQSIWYREATTDPWVEVPANWYWVVGLPGALTLQFRRQDYMDAGYNLKLVYLARPSEMTADTDTLGLGEPMEREAVAFIIEHALARLHEMMAGEDSGRFREHLTLASDHYQRAEKMLRAALPWASPGRVKGARQPRAARG